MQVTKPHDAQCAGQLQAMGTAGSKDVFLAKYSAKGAPRADYTMSTYGTGVQPEVHTRTPQPSTLNLTPQSPNPKP